MKRLLPHLFYLTLITGLGIFFWLRLKAENQLIALLNQPTDEAYIAVERLNRLIRNEIKRSVEGYPNERNIEYGRRARMADSLITSSFTDPVGSDSLSPRLWVLSEHNRELKPHFQSILLRQNQSVSSPVCQTVLAQNDSLRRLLLRLKMLDYFEMQVGGYLDIRFNSYQPAVSFTTLCPRVSEPFEMDILLSDYPPRVDIMNLSVNGQSLPYEDGLAHFEQTFSQTGVYPLQVKAEYLQFWENDSLSIVEKTFYLHVNH